jgi:hypothetical protein
MVNYYDVNNDALEKFHWHLGDRQDNYQSLFLTAVAGQYLS